MNRDCAKKEKKQIILKKKWLYVWGRAAQMLLTSHFPEGFLQIYSN